MAATFEAGADSLGAMIAKLKALPRVLVKDMMPAIAEIMREDLKATIAAGTTPEGEPWKPRKADGSRPLEGAAKALHVAAVGASVFVRLTGINAKHHWGAVRGGTKRRIIYTGTTLPPRVLAKIQALATERFKAHMGGSGDGV